MTRIILFAPVVGLLLSGCTLGIETNVEKLSYVKEEPKDIVAQFSRPGQNPDNGLLIGSLRLDFVSDIDLISLKKGGQYNVFNEAEICGRENEIKTWPYIFKNGISRNNGDGRTFHYSLFIFPDWESCRASPASKPEPICVRVRATKMVYFFSYRSNTMKIDRESICSALAESR